MRGIPLHSDPPEETSLRHGLTDERAKGQLPATASVLAKAGEDQTLMGEGVYVGEGLPPVPPKLAKRIRSGEFVEMEELLPEVCTRGDVKPEAKRRSRRAHDIFTWLQCFGVYASVRGSHSPEMIPELMAYMSTIIRTSREYAGTEWHTYDTLFRKHAALRRESKWLVINPTIYARCFTSAPRNPAKCELCLAVTHDTRDCSHREPSEDIETRLRSMEQSIQGWSPSQPRPIQFSGEVCRKYNKGECNYPYCKHTHVCSLCEGSHPAVRCTRRTRPATESKPAWGTRLSHGRQ